MGLPNGTRWSVIHAAKEAYIASEMEGQQQLHPIQVPSKAALTYCKVPQNEPEAGNKPEVEVMDMPILTLEHRRLLEPSASPRSQYPHGVSPRVVDGMQCLKRTFT